MSATINTPEPSAIDTTIPATKRVPAVILGVIVGMLFALIAYFWRGTVGD